MTAMDLKKYIYENKKIETILSDLGCHHIKYNQSKDYYSCCNPDGDNSTAVIVYNTEYLNCLNYTRKIEDKFDLIRLVGFYLKKDFKSSIKWLHKILNLKLTFENPKEKPKETYIDPLYIFKKIKHKKTKSDVLELEVLEENLLSDFLPNIHIDLFREGIVKKSIDKFGLGYSFKMRRTIFPYRYWLSGELLGYTGRTSIKNYDLFDIPKYYITPNYRKSLNLYGLWENYESIKKLGYVTVLESEKNVVKRHSRGDESCVALSGHTISDEQIRILIGLDVDIIIALDKDVSLEEIKFMCNKFKNIRNVYYIYDKYDLLIERESPADKPNNIYEYLFRYKTKY